MPPQLVLVDDPPSTVMADYEHTVLMEEAPATTAQEVTISSDEEEGNASTMTTIKQVVEEKSTASTPRQVSFSTTIRVHPVLHRRDMTPDEIQKSWVQPSDKEDMRRVVNSTLFLMKTGVASQLSDADYVCERGLEAFCDTGRSDRIDKSVKMALAMQRVLRRVGSLHDHRRHPTLIANAYRKCTIQSRALALRKARMDRQAMSCGTTAVAAAVPPSKKRTVSEMLGSASCS